ncbi:MAG TPA: ThiF family adenylyltransferase, partial [Gemmataceae bacterium]|nr:ThiF family adenylyltransferase [Gemmataceae bacterium]
TIMPSSPEPASPVETIRRRLSLDLLTRGRIVLIGLGGIGLILARYLTLFLSAFRDVEFRLVLCDGDAFEPANAYRMDVPDFDNKAAAVAAELTRLFGRGGLHVRFVPEYVTAQNAGDVIRPGDCVLLAVDNHATRLLVSQRCGRLDDVVLISGGNDGVEGNLDGTYGNVQIHVRRGGRDENPALEQFHPEIASPADRSPSELDCLELAAGGAPQMLFANLAMASAMCNALLRLLAPGRERMYDEACLDIHAGVCTPHWLTAPKDAVASAEPL